MICLFDTDCSTEIYKLNQSFWFILKFHFWSKKMWKAIEKRLLKQIHLRKWGENLYDFKSVKPDMFHSKELGRFAEVPQKFLFVKPRRIESTRQLKAIKCSYLQKTKIFRYRGFNNFVCNSLDVKRWLLASNIYWQ